MRFHFILSYMTNVYKDIMRKMKVWKEVSEIVVPLVSVHS